MNHRHIAKFLLVSASFLALELSVARADEVVRTKIGGSQIVTQITQSAPDNDQLHDRAKPDKAF